MKTLHNQLEYITNHIDLLKLSLYYWFKTILTNPKFKNRTALNYHKCTYCFKFSRGCLELFIYTIYNFEYRAGTRSCETIQF